MQPPLMIGTVLQNRYRLTMILGQGGFGRTYLAADQGRFNELCALKELIPAQTGNYFLEKSKELFQREATILYQIQHPQVPQFRATFEQDQRLFLVQDYVEGNTYARLLDERKAAGQTFFEVEVLQFLGQLLPVLAYLHSHGIIHRDISPDNIILRDRDHLPVLIDFGVVKELATRFQSRNTIEPTTVGKFGYAPSEQIQTGRAYPSSDLYALAVTAVVLLTGQQPQKLFDDTQLTWNWQRWVTLSPEVGKILNRMLSYKPGDRYQSAAEVAQALHSLTNPQAPDHDLLQTVAVGQRPRPNSPPQVMPPSTNRSIWEKPWAIAIIGIVVAILAGIGSWTLVSSILIGQRLAQSPALPPTQSPAPPQTFPSPLVSESPTPTPTASDTPTPGTETLRYSQRLNVELDKNTTAEGSLKANAIMDYTFRGEQGQQLSATLAENGILLTVLGPNQQPIDAGAIRVTHYQGALPFSGDYTIELSSVQGIAESNYQLNFRLENQGQPLPTTPTTTAAANIDVEQLNFTLGETRKVSGHVKPQQLKRYLVNAQAGQTLSVTVKGNAVTLDIRDPNGQLIENASKLQSWKAQLPSSGNYQIDVTAVADKDTDFTLNVKVRDLQ